MVENNPPSDGGQDESPWSPRGPGFEPQPAWAPLPAPQPPAPQPYAVPPAYATTPPYAAATALPRPARRGPRAGTVVLVAALTALVVGSAAGYGGSRLATRGTASDPVVTTAPSASADPTSPTSPDPSTTASPLPAAPAQANTVEIAKRVVPATVMIEVGDSTGSGFVLDRQGRIMTNNHVVAGAANGDRIRVVLSDGRRRGATLVGRSPSYDLAVVKLDRTSGLTPLPVGRSSSVQVGQPVVAVGARLGLPGTVTQGIISAKDRPVVVNANGAADAPTAYINAIQTDAPINPGNSGGPLVDAAGRVVGVNSAILTLGSGQGQAGSIGLGFAIPIDQATSIGQQLVARGKARYPVIGATVTDGSDGVRLDAVESGGPASDAGLRAGDVVTRIDDHPVTTMEELIVTVRTHKPGEQVVLDYTRGASRRSARVTLGGKEG